MYDRDSLLLQWARRISGDANLQLTLISGDASFRRYFRWQGDGRSLIRFREDYGSTWDGTVLIRNSRWLPPGGGSTLTMQVARLIGTQSTRNLEGKFRQILEETGMSVKKEYEMVALDAGVPNDKEMWDACTSQADCADPKPNAYPVSDVFTVVTKGFSEKAGVAMEYVKTRKWDNQTVGQLLAWKDENQGSNEDTAYYFLNNNKEMWTKWLPEDVAAKVEAEL